MKVTVIEATNFISHVHSRVELNGGRLSTFSGRNGAGKSAFLEVLLYVLYDAARGRTDDLVRLGSSEMSASVTFEFGGSTYRATRGRSTRAGGKSYLELHILDETPDVMDWRPLTADSIRETQAAIAELLRLDADTFATAAFLKQGEADRFISDTPAGRKRILASVLGLDRYERAEAHTRELARDVDARAAAGREQLVRIDEVLADETAHRDAEAHARHALEEYEIEAGLVGVELAEHRAAAADLAARIAEDAAAEAEATRLGAEVEAHVNRWKAARARGVTAAQQRDRAVATLAQEARITEATARVPVLTVALAEAKEAAEAWRTAEAVAEKSASDRRMVEHDIRAANDRRDMLAAQRNDTITCPECGAEIPAGGKALDELALRAEENWSAAVAALAALPPPADPPPTPDAEPWSIQQELSEAQALAAGAPALAEARTVIAEAAAAITSAATDATEAEEAGRAARAAVDAAKARVAGLAPLRAEHRTHVAEVDRLERREVAIATEVRAKERLHATAQARLDELAVARTARDELSTSIEASAAEVALLRRLVTAFGANGIPARIIESILPELSRYANELLEQLRPGMALDMRAQRAKRDGGMAEALDLVVRDDVGERGLAMFSGGERMSAALAIAVGLSRLVARRAGTAIRTLVVDEPDGLDDEARRAFGQALRILAHDGELERVLLVSHHEDLAEIGDPSYLVTKDAAGSHVEAID